MAADRFAGIFLPCSPGNRFINFSVPLLFPGTLCIMGTVLNGRNILIAGGKDMGQEKLADNLHTDTGVTGILLITQ